MSPAASLAVRQVWGKNKGLQQLLTLLKLGLTLKCGECSIARLVRTRRNYRKQPESTQWLPAKLLDCFWNTISWLGVCPLPLWDRALLSIQVSPISLLAQVVTLGGQGPHLWPRLGHVLACKLSSERKKTGVG